MTGFRTQTGGLIDRGAPISFTFDGRGYSGIQGDTIASALLANGVAVVGRSFKYHRPRGLWGAWVDEPNAIMTVTLNGVELPNCLATTTPLEQGMQVRAVNAWPNARHDVKAGLGLFHRWLTAGFYYKTFMWPDWRLFEPMIRKMAGLGAVSRDVPDGYRADQLYDACDALVVGGGAAGLAAARVAAERGEDVVLVDDHPQIGGGLHQMVMVEGKRPAEWVAEHVAAITSAGGRVMSRTTAAGVYDHGMVALVTNGAFGQAPTLRQMRAARVVMATGAQDRPMAFPDNDRPGVMSLFGAGDYLARYGVAPGQRVAVQATHALGDGILSSLGAAGCEVTELGSQDVRALYHGKLTGVRVEGRTVEADALLVSAGLTPLVHLWRYAGGKLDWCETRQAFVPGQAPEGMTAIGAANGVYELDLALDEARGTETDAAQVARIVPTWPQPGAKGRQWIDFQHDVTLKDVELAARENYVSVEHLKRYTTLGMASDQGKTSNMAGLAAMAAIRGRPIPEVGTTTFRPPFVPVPLESYRGHLSAERLHPLKRLPLEDLHRAERAALGEYGGWLRPAWYGGSDPKAAIRSELRTARDAVGLFDGSPLGKVEVCGPDAATFLNFVFYNTISTLRNRHIRYGFMLTESGTVFDDGVVSRLDDARFLVSCSSGHVDAVVRHLESWRQDGNDPDRIFVHDLTQGWTTLTVTGPRARAVVQALALDLDLSAQAMPHMRLEQTRWQDAPLRLARVSFTGDLSYEVSVPVSRAEALWNTLLPVVRREGGGLLGIEALSVLRAEKGYVMVGKDTDGETMPQDLGFDGPRWKKKSAFLGDRGLHTAKANAPDRKRLVGLKIVQGKSVPPTGAHVIAPNGPLRSAGFVTSSYADTSLGRPVVLALVEAGFAQEGKEIALWHDNVQVLATVCNPCLHDPEGERLHA